MGERDCDTCRYGDSACEECRPGYTRWEPDAPEQIAALKARLGLSEIRSEKRRAVIEKLGAEQGHFFGRIEVLTGQIAALEARLEDDSPGTMLARFNALGNWAERELGDDPTSSRGFERRIYETFAALKAEVADLKDDLATAQAQLDTLRGMAEAAHEKSKLGAAAQQVEDIGSMCRDIAEEGQKCPE